MKKTMGEQKNIVVINGKTYDASTGDLISGGNSTPIKVNVFTNPDPEPITQPVKRSHQPRRSQHHIAHHRPQKSVTLKRTQPKLHGHATSAKSIPVSTASTITVTSKGKHLVTHNRLERAKKIDKSSSISRFNPASTVNKTHQPIEVKPAPPTPAFHAPAPKVDHSTQSGEDLFNQALNHANSHTQSHHNVSRRKHRIAKKLGMSARTGNIVTAILVVAVLGSFIAYQNGPNIAMRMAASKSGLTTASLPSYKPSGFSLSRQVSSQPGQVSLNYHSNSDDRSFTVTQASSSWNSQTLADSFLNDKQTQTIDQSNGKTIYLYGNSNATWVDGGVWYRVEGNSSLTSDQLLKLANSF